MEDKSTKQQSPTIRIWAQTNTEIEKVCAASGWRKTLAIDKAVKMLSDSLKRKSKRAEQ